jgi:hypothetical protein
MVEQSRDIQNSLFPSLFSERFVIEVTTTINTINICVMKSIMDFGSKEPIDVSRSTSNFKIIENGAGEGI